MFKTIELMFKSSEFKFKSFEHKFRIAEHSFYLDLEDTWQGILRYFANFIYQAYFIYHRSTTSLH